MRARLSAYQTGSPLRDYAVFAAARFGDATLAERIMHDRLTGHRVGNTEWFLIHPTDAKHHLRRLSNEEQSR